MVRLMSATAATIVPAVPGAPAPRTVHQSLAPPASGSLPVPLATPASGSLPVPLATPASGSLPVPLATPASGPLPVPLANPASGSLPVPLAIPASGSLPVPLAIPASGSLPVPLAIPASGSLPVPLATPASGSLPVPLATPAPSSGHLPQATPAASPAAQNCGQHPLATISLHSRHLSNAQPVLGQFSLPLATEAISSAQELTKSLQQELGVPESSLLPISAAVLDNPILTVTRDSVLLPPVLKPLAGAAQQRASSPRVPPLPSLGPATAPSPAYSTTSPVEGRTPMLFDNYFS